MGEGNAGEGGVVGGWRGGVGGEEGDGGCGGVGGSGAQLLNMPRARSRPIENVVSTPGAASSLPSQRHTPSSFESVAAIHTPSPGATPAAMAAARTSSFRAAVRIVAKLPPSRLHSARAAAQSMPPVGAPMMVRA